MKVSIISKKGLKINLKVIVESKIINEQIQEKLDQLKKTINLKGFRPGKVPTEVIKKQFGKSVYGDVLDKLLKETCTKALNDNSIKVAGQPKINLTKHGENKDLEYTIEVEKLPEIKTNPIEDIKITNYTVKVSDKDLDKRINDIAKNHKNYKERKENEAAINEDQIIFDYKAMIEDKDFEGNKGDNVQIILGKDLFIKHFDKQLIGVKKNDERKVNVTLPENYPDKKYSNKKATFFCKIKNIKKPESFKIDDDFAKTLGAKNLIDLKAMVSKQIQDQYKNTFDSISKKEIIENLEKFKNIEIPDSLVEQETELLNKNMSVEEIEKNKNKNKKIAENRIKVGLILNELGEKNNLKVSEEEIKSAIQKQIQMMPGESKQVMEFYQKNPAAIAQLRGGIYEDKIISLIKEKTKSVTKTITIDEADKIIINENQKSEKIQKTKEIESKYKKTTKKTTLKKKVRKK